MLLKFTTLDNSIACSQICLALDIQALEFAEAVVL